MPLSVGKKADGVPLAGAYKDSGNRKKGGEGMGGTMRVHGRAEDSDCCRA